MKQTTFILTGVRNDKGVCTFSFEGVGPDRVRMPGTVETDLALLRKHDIRLQDLPLLCRGLLDRAETMHAHANRLGEPEMISQ